MRRHLFKLLLLCLLPLAVVSQDPGPRRGFGRRVEQPDQQQPFNAREEFMRKRRGTGAAAVKFGEFTFTRLRYGGGGGRRGGWATDYPEADEHFVIGLQNWVQGTLHITDDPTTVSPVEPKLFQYPFVYIVEPGRMYLEDDHAAQLREYLLRGGFLMLDDFWGSWEYANVLEQLRKVFPEYPVKELSLDHPIFHCYFDINEVLQVPQIGYIYSGVTYEQDGYTPHYEAITDDNGRVMVFIARNADNGDAWEWIDDSRYPLKYGLGAYRLGTNLIVYAMTH